MSNHFSNLNSSSSSSSSTLATDILDIFQTIDLYYRGILIMFGLIGNSLTIVIFWRTKLTHSKRTSYYLIRLALSDICFLLTLSVGYLDTLGLIQIHSTNWIVCKLSAYLGYICTFISCVLVLTFTAQRLFVICFPLRINLLTVEKWSKILMAVAIVFAFAFYSLCLPFYDVMLEDAEDNSSSMTCKCKSDWEDYAEYFNCLDSVLTFIIPFFGMLVMNCMMINTLKTSSYNFIVRTSTNRHFSGNDGINPNALQATAGNGHSRRSIHMASIQTGMHAGLGTSDQGRESETLTHSNMCLSRRSKKRTFSVSSPAMRQRSGSLCYSYCFRSKGQTEDDDEFEKMEDTGMSRYTNYADRRAAFYKNRSDRVIEEENEDELFSRHHSSNKDPSERESSGSSGAHRAAGFVFNRHKDSMIKYKSGENLSSQQQQQYQKTEVCGINMNNEQVSVDDGVDSPIAVRRNMNSKQCKCRYKCLKCIFMRPALSSFDSMFSAKFINGIAQNEHSKPMLPSTAVIIRQKNNNRKNSVNKGKIKYKYNRSVSLFHNRSAIGSPGPGVPPAIAASSAIRPPSMRRSSSFKINSILSHNLNCSAYSQATNQTLNIPRSHTVNNSFVNSRKSQTRSMEKDSADGERTSFRIAGAKTNSVSRRVTKMLLLVSTIFLMLNLPIHVFNIYVSIRVYIDKKPTLSEIEQISQTVVSAFFYTSFSVNFLLYSISGVTFRTEYTRLFFALVPIKSRINKTK